LSYLWHARPRGCKRRTNAAARPWPADRAFIYTFRACADCADL